MISQNMLNLFRKKLQDLRQRQFNAKQSQSQRNHFQEARALDGQLIIFNRESKDLPSAYALNIGKDLKELKDTQSQVWFKNDDKQISFSNISTQVVKKSQNKLNEDFMICPQKKTNEKVPQKSLRNNIFGFRLCPSPLFPDTNKKIFEDNSLKNTQVLVKKLSQKSESIGLDESFNEQQKNYTLKVPHLYFMNNLIALYGKVHPNLIRLYIKQVSRKHKIPYNEILASFGIEQMVAKFYQSHELQCQLTPKYILSQMSINIPPFVAQMCISNWSLICKIAQGAMNRFKIKQYYNDEWLMNQLKKKGKLQRENGNNMERILKLSKLGGKDINMAAHDKEVENNNYTKMKAYLSKYEQKVNKQIVFQDTDEQLLEESNRVGIQSKLKFYKSLKLKLMASKQKSKKQYKVQKQKPDELEQKQYGLLSFFIGCMILKVPDDAIFLQEYVEQEDVSISSGKQQRQGLKYMALKQKVKQKQLQKNQRHQREKKRQRPQAQKPAARKTVQSVPKISKTVLSTSVQTKKPQELIVRSNISADNQIEQKALKQLDFKLFEFHQQQPDFSMSDLVKQIYRILKQLKIPDKFANKITTSWFNKYQKG